MNIVEKVDGRVKVRAVADGSKERTVPGYKKKMVFPQPLLQTES